MSNKLEIADQQAIFPSINDEASIVEARRALEKAIANSSGKDFRVDLSQVSSVSSAFLSLLVRVSAKAESSRCQLSFHGIPEPMLSMAKVYGVDAILPLH